MKAAISYCVAKLYNGSENLATIYPLSEVYRQDKKRLSLIPCTDYYYDEDPMKVNDEKVYRIRRRSKDEQKDIYSRVKILAVTGAILIFNNSFLVSDSMSPV